MGGQENPNFISPHNMATSHWPQTHNIQHISSHFSKISIILISFNIIQY